VIREGQLNFEILEHDDWDNSSLNYLSTGETLVDIADESVPIRESVSRPNVDINADVEVAHDEPTMEVQSKTMEDDSDLFDDSGNFVQQERVRQDVVIPSSGGSSSSGLQDKWTKEGTRWIRHHVRLRQNLFVPSSELGGPLVERLQSRRITRYRFADNSDGTTLKRVDQWNSEDPTMNEFLLPNS